jgi:hypothetical protein
MTWGFFYVMGDHMSRERDIYRTMLALRPRTDLTPEQAKVKLDRLAARKAERAAAEAEKRANQEAEYRDWLQSDDSF